jgi:hypothetical protein
MAERSCFEFVFAALCMSAIAGCDDSSGTGGAGGTASTTGVNMSSSTGMSTAANMSTTSSAMASMCVGTGAVIDTLPACASATSSPVVVKSGCEPSADGAMHADEWADATCFTAGDMTFAVKVANGSLYMASAGHPACGCPMAYVFDPDHAGAANGDEYLLGLFDDPFMKDGDRFDNVLMGGTFVMGSAPAGIVTACPGSTPDPIPYEIKLPYAAIGATAGGPHDLGFAFVHAGSKWPASLALDAMGQATDPSTYGTLSLP